MTSGQLWPEESREGNVSKSRTRKRRRTAGGAGEDCWTCKRRAIACDRKRPYCTQCIEIGRECSGYKTVLSWGVGVASRGKLRGLSCPVANKNVDGSDVITAAPKKNNASTNKRYSSVAEIKLEEGVDEDSTSSIPVTNSTSITNLQQPSASDQHMQQNFHHADDGILSNLESTMISQFSNPLYHGEKTMLPLLKTEMPPPNAFDMAVPSNLSRYNENFPAISMSSGLNSIPLDQISSLNLVSPSQPGSLDSFSPAYLNVQEDYLLSADPSQLLYSPQTISDEFNQDDIDKAQSTMMSLQSYRFSTPFYHVSPRLQSLMEYYDRHICPYLVAFDGPENPYRKHILSLAINNEGLQNALAALSSNNNRMRIKESRSRGFVTEIGDRFEPLTTVTSNETVAEENCYKQMSINQLNKQLAHRTAAQDDSVLATLLILCLYHVCDSGFSKFKTQLQGVQRLLAFRDPKNESEFTRWVHMFFTWFDVMTSTVNDRETEIRGDAMAMLDFSSNLGAMEQFSGCDGRLFKLIARLGRLNLLAQGRDVKPQRDSQHMYSGDLTDGHDSRPTKRRKHKPNSTPIRSLSAADYRNIDGNGWGTPIISSDSGSDPENLEDTSRSEFWSEWHDIRSRLHEIQLMTPTSPFPNSAHNLHELQTGQRDMQHINESFRCSALLYTERLGHPLRPSSHPSFQTLVKQALENIGALAIDSCVNKFLLWPLFIIGTEAVDPQHRDIIRRRCVEVQRESGFYNNLSSLDVLEKVWAETGAGGVRSEDEERRARRRDSQGRVGAFRWRLAMDRVDGEYIVI